jgi:hypothetical protein
MAGSGNNGPPEIPRGPKLPRRTGIVVFRLSKIVFHFTTALKSKKQVTRSVIEYVFIYSCLITESILLEKR